jgi:SAM-dependent methyltransferase
MLERAARRARAIGSDVPLAQMNLLDPAFDGAFDTVVATFVLLCLPDGLQLAALRELRRVCRPDGRILLLDYRLPSYFALRAMMRLLSPWLRWAFHGGTTWRQTAVSIAPASGRRRGAPTPGVR